MKRSIDNQLLDRVEATTRQMLIRIIQHPSHFVSPTVPDLDRDAVYQLLKDLERLIRTKPRASPKK